MKDNAGTKQVERSENERNCIMIWQGLRGRLGRSGCCLGAPHPQLAWLPALPASQLQGRHTRHHCGSGGGGVVSRLHGADRRELAKANPNLDRNERS